MKEWYKTGCVLCAQNCGIEVLVENGRMVSVKPDKDNPRSKGYVCRKGLNVIYHQYPADRITEPLKKVGGRFEPVGWAQAIDEISDKMKGILGKHGPESYAYMGASAQGGNFEGTFGVTLLRALGSQNFYSSAGQEFSGCWWLFGRMLGRQYNVAIPDEHRSEMLVAWGWNGMMSHQMPRAGKFLTEMSKDPERLFVAVDPRESETAAIADIHLPVRPGTDALLMKAVIAIIVKNGWEKSDYITAHVDGWEKIRPWFEHFDYKTAVEVCELSLDQVMHFAELLTTKKWSVHPDLGIYMGRNSTLNTYFLFILCAICGRFCVSGGNVIPGMIMPMGFHADERNPKVWRTRATNMPPAAAGSFPPNVMPEEILSDREDRIRMVHVSACNPLRAYADTSAWEEAFGKLDLLVVNDIVMSETARLAHYVLPCRTFYESWDGTFFPMTFPEVYFQMRSPIADPPGMCLEAAQIFTMIADNMGLIPEIPDELHLSVQTDDRLTFGTKLMDWAMKHPEAPAVMPFVLAKTMGRMCNSATLAALWGMLMTAPRGFRENAERAGFEPGPDQGERIFQAIIDNPQGLWVGKADIDGNWANIKTPSGKIELIVPELDAPAAAITAESEAADLVMPKDFPLILNAGRHMDYNCNTLMRNPEWNKGKRACTIAVNPDDAESMGFSDGQSVRVVTRAGSEIGELEISSRVRKGMVLIPHGFGLIYDGKKTGINVNRLTQSTHRDFLGTPIHRFVPCRLEAAIS